MSLHDISEAFWIDVIWSALMISPNLRCSRGIDTKRIDSEAQLLQCTLDKCNEYCMHCSTHSSNVLLGLVLIQEIRKQEA